MLTEWLKPLFNKITMATQRPFGMACSLTYFCILRPTTLCSSALCALLGFEIWTICIALPALSLLYSSSAHHSICNLQVGFFPCDCVELINDKIPPSVQSSVPKPGTVLFHKSASAALFIIYLALTCGDTETIDLKCLLSVCVYVCPISISV